MSNTARSYFEYTWKSINSYLDTMRGMFDIVRLVDAEECREIEVDEQGQLRFGRACYAVWNADHRCANCTSYQACHSHRKKQRIEQFNGVKYQIQSIPVRITLPDETVYSCNIEFINFRNVPEQEEGSGAEKDTIETTGYLSTHDKLTGIFNWDGFCRSVREKISGTDQTYLLIAVHIQNFKLVNSLFGRSKGDEVLMEMTRVLGETYGKDGVIARTGGNTFAVCIAKEDGVEKSMFAVMKQVKSLVDNPSYHLNIHAGVYEMDNPNLPVSIMFDRSYMALQSIRDHRERVVVWFEDSMLQNAIHEQKVISDFENNLKSGQFVIYVQPQVNQDGHIEGGECLVRWILPDGKLVPPFEFIGILEQSDLISSLDRYVWELAAKQLHAWKGTRFGDLYLSVNVSPQDFYYIDVAKTILELTEKYEIDPKMLRVEITETAVADELQNNRATIERLRESGFLVEIDDFGKGSSSLSMLKDINADVLKIDMGFLRKSENTARSNIILESVIDMAKRLGMGVISEGVETEGQLANLTAMGCEMFQGYYFSKPIPVAAFEELVREWRSGAV